MTVSPAIAAVLLAYAAATDNRIITEEAEAENVVHLRQIEGA
jgi:hypothetical protein